MFLCCCNIVASPLWINKSLSFHISTEIDRSWRMRKRLIIICTNIFCDLLHESNQTIGWLHLASANGSIPSALIHAAMDHYHNPQHIKWLITGYFGRIQPHSRAALFMTQWQSHEKGIVTRCTTSPSLLVMGMNLLISHAEKELTLLCHIATCAKTKFNPNKSRRMVIRKVKQIQAPSKLHCSRLLEKIRAASASSVIHDWGI